MIDPEKGTLRSTKLTCMHTVTQELNLVKQRLSSRHYLLSSFQPPQAHPNVQETHGTYDIPCMLERPLPQDSELELTPSRLL